jgi:hypothetical protein
MLGFVFGCWVFVFWVFGLFTLAARERISYGCLPAVAVAVAVGGGGSLFSSFLF